MPRITAVTNPKDSTAASTFICHLISIVASLAAGGTAGPLGRWGRTGTDNGTVELAVPVRKAKNVAAMHWQSSIFARYALI